MSYMMVSMKTDEKVPYTVLLNVALSNLFRRFNSRK